MPKDPRGH
jgi:hypothetical protein